MILLIFAIVLIMMLVLSAKSKKNNNTKESHQEVKFEVKTQNKIKKEKKELFNLKLVDVNTDKFTISWHSSGMDEDDIIIIDIHEAEMFYKSLRVNGLETNKLIDNLQNNTYYYVDMQIVGQKKKYQSVIKTFDQECIAFELRNVGPKGCELLWESIEDTNPTELVFEIYECEKATREKKSMIYRTMKKIEDYYLHIDCLQPNTCYIIDVLLPFREKKLSQIFTTLN